MANSSAQSLADKIDKIIAGHDCCPSQARDYTRRRGTLVLIMQAIRVQRKVDMENKIARVVQSVNDWDDRTSPEDYPDHLLITSEELADILRNFADALEDCDNG